MPRRYAEGTTVPIEKTKAEIEEMLRRNGARNFVSGFSDDKGEAVILFEAHSRRLRFLLPMPDIKEFNKSKSGQQRTPEQRYKYFEAGCRQRWRALLLAIKAKLEAVAAGISEFEEEFLAHIVLPNNETTAQWLRPQIAEAYQQGKMPAATLLMLEGPKSSA